MDFVKGKPDPDPFYKMIDHLQGLYDASFLPITSILFTREGVTQPTDSFTVRASNGRYVSFRDVMEVINVGDRIGFVGKIDDIPHFAITPSPIDHSRTAACAMSLFIG